MKKYHTLFIILPLLSSCISQSMAPIEYKSSSAAANHKAAEYSERTMASLPDDGQIDIKTSTIPTKSTITLDEKYTENNRRQNYTSKNKMHQQKYDENQNNQINEDEIKATPLPEREIDTKSLEEELTNLENNNSQDQHIKSSESAMPLTIPHDHAESSGKVFSMPVAGEIIKNFGVTYDGKKSNGINIAASHGEPIRSISDGSVVYSGVDHKFGNLVIIKIKDSDMFAAYANMDDLMMHQGASVTRGQIIGHVGDTGDVSSPQLHLALRKGKTPVDPMKYIKK